METQHQEKSAVQFSGEQGQGVGQTEATEKEGPEAAEMRKKGPERSERGKEEGGIVERAEEEEEGREEDEPVRGWRPWG